MKNFLVPVLVERSKICQSQLSW